MKNCISYPDALPVTAEKKRIIETIRQNKVVIIAGDTGSGKSTQVPKMCLEAGQGEKKLIGCTQPRRLAATSIAARVREELDTLGYLVGYKIRFSDQTNPATRIKFMTDGILLAENRNDPELRAYDTLIIDEAHERSLNIDFLLGILKKILRKRSDLKIIITSATIDTAKFSRAFDGAPVIEVSGRTYPVEIRYAVEAGDVSGELAFQDMSYVEQAAQAVLDLCRAGQAGDMLVFMPTERDIRDTVELLGKRFRNDGPQLGIKEKEPGILPLFGRLSGAEQNKIFAKYSTRKIVVCTNVAETSVTVPGIRFVVDTGLARISSYNVRSGTTKLPVSSISRASCDQRAGRCGRVGPGVCIRLYSEEDYRGRPEFTLPEIVRANLAEVILRMIALRLGSPKKFPFVDPPAPRAVHDGYKILTELGAISREKKLTRRGEIMAGLPLDPRISRMIISSRDTGCLREVVIIAAALSIQDPRIRPTENMSQADAAHAGFRSAHSDFFSFLHLWDAAENQARQKKSVSSLRKFCRNNFLSFQRMREWRDIHGQIWSQLATVGSSREKHLFLKSSCRDGQETDREKVYAGGYDRIHQAILAGNLRHIGLKKEKNIYQGGHGKELMIFPGSTRFNKAGQWIMAAELVETSRLYARTVAGIRPEWIEPLAGELCHYSYSSPHWEKKSGQVTALAKVTLFGLVIDANRRVNFGTIKPEEARQIFIQSALVEGECGGHFHFLEKNRQLINELTELEDRMRRRDILVDDFHLYEFYDKRLPADVFDRAGLIRLLKKDKNNNFLLMRREDILRQLPENEALADYPENIHCGELTLPLSYSFTPGEENDGVTVTIPADLAGYVQAEKLEWLVPGLLREKIIFLLKALPKSIRRNLIPIPRTAEELLTELRIYEGSLYRQIEDLIGRRFRLRIEHDVWALDLLPPHLRMRCRLVDGEGKDIGADRDLPALMKTPSSCGESPGLAALRNRWEKTHLLDWDFAGIPERITIKDKDGKLTGFAHPGLVAENDGSVSLRLFADSEECRARTTDGLRVLYCLKFAMQCRGLRKDLVLPRASWSLYEGIASHELFHEELLRFVLVEIFRCRAGLLPSRDEFSEIVDRVKKEGIYESAMRIMSRVVDVLRERRLVLDFLAEMEQNSRREKKIGLTLADYAVFRQEVTALLPPEFLRELNLAGLNRIPCYLKAIRIRVERKIQNQAKDAEKALLVAIQQERLKQLLARSKGMALEKRLLVRQFAMMIEEFKVSLFAQELKTAFPISGKRLDKVWEETCKALDDV